MKLCVGACSRLIIEESAKLRIAQIVASRRQVDIGGGYTGLDQYGLVELVNDLSGGATQVVRDHGGPRQGGTDDDGVASLEQDVDAGFDALHLDVCELQREEQHDALRALMQRFTGRIKLEVGEEHAEQEWNDQLWLTAREFELHTVVVSTGTFVWADGQYGSPRSHESVSATVALYHAAGYATKAHNMDWMTDRAVWAMTGLDYYNLAPEIGAVEIDAILAEVGSSRRKALLNYAHDSGRWRRWFSPGSPKTPVHRDAQARCALRYLRDDPVVLELIGDAANAASVHEAVRRALVIG